MQLTRQKFTFSRVENINIVWKQFQMVVGIEYGFCLCAIPTHIVKIPFICSTAATRLPSHLPHLRRAVASAFRPNSPMR